MLRRNGPCVVGLIAAGTVGCASEPERDPVREQLDLSIEETFVYLETHRPPTVASIRHRLPLHYDVVNARFVYMKESAGHFLLEMARDCKQLTSREYRYDMTDRENKRYRIRAGHDSIRGCRIVQIYELSDIEETPAENSGESEATTNTATITSKEN